MSTTPRAIKSGPSYSILTSSVDSTLPIHTDFTLLSHADSTLPSHADSALPSHAVSTLNVILEVLPTSSALPVMVLAILSMWAAHCAPDTYPVHESVSDTSPVHESVSNTSPVHESVLKVSSVHESAPEISPINESVTEVSPVLESVPESAQVPESATVPPEVAAYAAEPPEGAPTSGLSVCSVVDMEAAQELSACPVTVKGLSMSLLHHRFLIYRHHPAILLCQLRHAFLLFWI